MGNILSIAKVAATGVCLAAIISAPARAASVQSEAFVANARPNVTFIDEASRLALDKSPSRAVRSFAYREARDATITANSLVAWTQTNTLRGEAVAVGAPVVPVLPAVTDLAFAPVAVASGVVVGAGDVVTGRSVAIDTPLTVRPSAVAPVGSTLLPAEQDDLSRLQARSGRDFDILYKSTQLDALRQLATVYSDYQVNGDDPALRAIATRELPKINARIAELRRL